VDRKITLFETGFGFFTPVKKSFPLAVEPAGLPRGPAGGLRRGVFMDPRKEGSE